MSNEFLAWVVIFFLITSGLLGASVFLLRPGVKVLAVISGLALSLMLAVSVICAYWTLC